MFDATAASSLSAATTSTSIKELKGVQEPSVFPAAGAPASTGESLNQPGQIASVDMVTKPGQITPGDKATGVDGRVVGLEGAPGASAEGGVCVQAAAEHSEEMKDGGEAEDLSEEKAEVAVGGFSTGSEAGLLRVVAEWEVEDDGESTVGLNNKRVTDSTAPRQAGTRSSRADGTGTSIDPNRLTALTIVICEGFVSTNHLQCSSLELNNACRRVSTFVVTVGESCMPLDRLARSKKHEVRVCPATTEKR